jgi:phosphatidylglycerophosphatase GEP4
MQAEFRCVCVITERSKTDSSQSESVSHHLGISVLLHKSFKPAYSCISSVRAYFSGLKSPLREDELIVVGDRIFTDVVMANRMRMARDKEAKSPNLIQMSMQCAFEKEGTVATEKETVGINDMSITNGPLAVWTTGVWKRESMAMRYLEKRLVDAVQKWSKPPGDEPLDTKRFVKSWSEPLPPQKIWLEKVIWVFKWT